MNRPTFSQWRPHPWHGLPTGERAPEVVNAFIEITPFDLAKYEIDKESGYLRLDRPQGTSSLPPTLYGFIPRTYCGERVTRLSSSTDKSDRDPLDICVFCEHLIGRSEVLVRAKVIGGLHFVDNGEADDKIFAVLEGDNFWGHAEKLEDLPPVVVERVQHYFASYKSKPGARQEVVFKSAYGLERALEVIRASMADYEDTFGQPASAETRS